MEISKDYISFISKTHFSYFDKWDHNIFFYNFLNYIDRDIGKSLNELSLFIKIAPDDFIITGSIALNLLGLLKRPYKDYDIVLGNHYKKYFEEYLYKPIFELFRENSELSASMFPCHKFTNTINSIGHTTTYHINLINLFDIDFNKLEPKNPEAVSKIKMAIMVAEKIYETSNVFVFDFIFYDDLEWDDVLKISYKYDLKAAQSIRDAMDLAEAKSLTFDYLFKNNALPYLNLMSPQVIANAKEAMNNEFINEEAELNKAIAAVRQKLGRDYSLMSKKKIFGYAKEELKKFSTYIAKKIPLDLPMDDDTFEFLCNSLMYKSNSYQKNSEDLEIIKKSKAFKKLVFDDFLDSL